MSTKPVVELIYDLSCPNIVETRRALINAFKELDLTPRWKEWDRNSNDTPSYARNYGSPTILINGEDIIEESRPTESNNCRLYQNASGKTTGVPSLELLKTSLLSIGKDKKRVEMRNVFASIPGIAFALLPKLTCAACWPIYAGVMSSLGIGFFNYSDYLLPITGLALLVALSALGYRANTRRGYSPLLLGIVSSILILVGKFILEIPFIVYLGIASLIIANLWNAWPIAKPRCSACVPDEKGEILK